MCQLSLIELNRYMESKGFNITIEKKQDGKYSAHLWSNDEYVKESQLTYKDQHEARKQTSINIYKAIGE